MSDLNKPYNPQEVEDKIYKKWEESGYFNPDNLDQKAEPYTIIMPPPNANAPIHIGHALFITIEDVMIRYQRMLGKRSLWLPGTDHAGFETQVVFEKKLEKEGRSRFKMKREDFYKEVYDFVVENKRVTENGLRKMGASCDWSRNIFTLDPRVIKIVYETFEQMMKDGLIYREQRIGNWCVKHQTTLSNLETDYKEQTDPLYFIKYGPLELATVRPETKFGDTALAVNPKDKRYKKYVGKEIEAEGLLGRFKIKVIADEAVDPEFGTGVVKVTPAHDPTDFEIWQRHKEEMPAPKQVIDQQGRLNESTGPYAGMKISDARKKVVEDMIKKGLLDRKKTKNEYKHRVQLCYKCGTIIEPLILPQWFVAITKKLPDGRPSLRDMAVVAVKNKNIAIKPERFEKVYLHWLENIVDWPISRQIWWGIPIPAWFHEPKCVAKDGDNKNFAKCEEIIISETKPRCEYCDAEYVQDPDTFDTWFSSGQWPYATLMAHGQKDFKTYFPTQLMETGWDILFFWVARMIMFSYYKTNQAPFQKVLLHGLVRDKDRRKMSKSKGNVVDPIAVSQKYGTDALRFALVFSSASGTDVILAEDKIKGMKHFANKLWNIARFVLNNVEKKNFEQVVVSKTDADKIILNKLEKTKKNVASYLDNLDLHEAAQEIYSFVWHEFADKYIEGSKTQLKNDKIKKGTQVILAYVLLETLKMLHPFMPFITEEIYQKLPKKKGLLMMENW